MTEGESGAIAKIIAEIADILFIFIFKEGQVEFARSPAPGWAHSARVRFRRPGAASMMAHPGRGGKPAQASHCARNAL
jgi:hypothetical protein